MNDIETIFLIVAVLYIWFNTEAFIEYARLFRLKFFNYNDYFIKKNTQLGLLTAKNYPIFLANSYPTSFLIKIITCPECMIVWSNVLFCVIVWKWKAIGIDIVLTWTLYAGISKFLRWCNE